MIHACNPTSPRHTIKESEKGHHDNMCVLNVPCRYVEREVNASGSVFVAAVEEAHGIQTGPGDLLFLKGQSYPGLYGEHHATR